MASLWNRLVSLVLLGATIFSAAEASPGPSGGVFGQMDRDKVKAVGLARGDLAEYALHVPGAAGLPSDYAGPWYKYASTSFCNSALPGAGGSSDNSCTSMWTVCNPTRDPEVTAGPAVNVWRQQVDAANQPLPGAAWERLGFTCLPDLVPGADNVLTAALILKQFHDTNFAHPTVSVQPVNGRTLVNLPTYFELKWPEAGFQPDEVDTTTLIGRQVRIKPALKQAVYVFGDGQSFGPTTSLGGPHPTGDVTHTYRSTANAQVRVDVTYSGQFSVDGGPWIDVPGEATVAGDPFPLEVLEAHAQLVTR